MKAFIAAAASLVFLGGAAIAQESSVEVKKESMHKSTQKTVADEPVGVSDDASVKSQETHKHSTTVTTGGSDVAPEPRIDKSQTTSEKRSSTTTLHSESSPHTAGATSEVEVKKQETHSVK